MRRISVVSGGPLVRKRHGFLHTQGAKLIITEVNAISHQGQGYTDYPALGR
jgi:hypothetical protein